MYATTFTGNLVGNVTGNVTGNVSGSSGSCTGNSVTATTATYTSYIMCPDTRATVINPNGLKATEMGIRFDFKQSSVTGLSASYSGVMSYRPYASGSDWSGGPAHQLAFDANGLHWRKSSGDTTWNSWKHIAFTDSNITGSSASCTGNSATATKVGVASIWMYPENNNEVNFGGTNTDTTIYFAYRAKDSRAIPTKFMFGGSTGASSIQADKLIGGSGRFTLQWNSTDSSIDFVFA